MPEASDYNQLYIGIIINAIIALIIAVLFKFVIIPKIERKYERNEFNVHIGVMGLVNSFDQRFKFFYDSFEHFMGDIQNLKHDEWLPDTHEEWTTNETDGMTCNLKPESEYSQALQVRQKFNELNEDLFKKDEQGLRDYAKTIHEYIEKNENYLDPVLRRYIRDYVIWTIFYVEWLRKNWNYSEQLFKRLEYAQKIIELLKKEESFAKKFSRFWKRKNFEKYPQIGEFVKKWQDYINSELGH